MSVEVVPFLDVHASYAELQSDIDRSIARVLESGRYILGDEVTKFEVEFAEFVGSSFCVSVGNGLDALRLALSAVGVCPGDEVIVPSHTFIATWLAISQCGAIPVPVEPEIGGFNIDPLEIEDAITERTKAIVVVHLYGQPARINEILQVAKKHGLRVVEDAAQAHGAAVSGRRIGSHSDAIAWSFYPSKNLGAFGDGGAVTLNDQQMATRIQRERNYGSEVKYVHQSKGINSRLDPLQATVLRVKLKHLDTWNQRRRELANLYIEGLASSECSVPTVANDSEPVWHLFVIRHNQRDRLQDFLTKSGIEVAVHYPIPPHAQAAYAELSLSFRRAEQLASEVLSLPIGPHLTANDVERVIGRILDFRY